ncbi:MAG: nucleoside deaminase [Mucinivorans sp.]
MDDERYMKMALDEAHRALELGEVPIGAVVVGGNRVLARAHNLTQTLSDPTAHAEMQAITSACHAVGGKYLPQCTIYVSVEPCPMCAAALYWAQIGGLVYGADDPKRGYSIVSPNVLHPKTIVKKGVLQMECSALVKEFFEKIRRKI